MKYRKRPIVIDAIQWDGAVFVRPANEPVPNWIVEASMRSPTEEGYLEARGVTLRIATLEGVMTANPHDWIIRGVKGELYPCKNEIFEASYEPAPVFELGAIQPQRTADMSEGVARPQPDPNQLELLNIEFVPLTTVNVARPEELLRTADMSEGVARPQPGRAARH